MMWSKLCDPFLPRYARRTHAQRSLFQHVDKPLRVYVYSYDFEYVHRPFSPPLAVFMIFVVIFERWSSCPIVIGAVRVFLAVSLGSLLRVPPMTSQLTTIIVRFGHLHRLPSQPADRKPDTPLPSIQEQENWEDNQDFYPADLSPSRSSSSLDQQRQSHRSPPMAHPRPTRPNDTTSYGVSRQPTFSPSPSFRTPSIGGRPLGPTSLNGDSPPPS